MPITRSDLEARLQSANGHALTVALSDPVTGERPTGGAVLAFLAWTAFRAAEEFGLATATYGVVVDDDLAALAEEDLPEFFLRASLATKREMFGRLALVDLSSGSNKQFRSQVAAKVRQDIKDLEGEIRDRFGASRRGVVIAGPMTAFPDYGAGGFGGLSDRVAPPDDWRFP